MGKKSRRKKHNKRASSGPRNVGVNNVGVNEVVIGDKPHTAKQSLNSSDSNVSLVLLKIIRWGAYTALFAPIIVHRDFFFPFVVPKTVFFWMFTEVMAACWVLLLINNERFRPKWNLLSIAVALFVLITIITSFTGINIERSFWSTFERMAGTITWIHLALFFFVLSATFKSIKEWRGLVSASVIAALLVSIIFFLDKVGISVTPLDTKSGSTIGNSSFMAAYLIFNVFLGIWLFVGSKYGWPKIFYGIAVGLTVLAVLLSTAHGALLAMVGGLFIIFLAWLFFEQKIRFARQIAFLLLVFGILAGGVVSWGAFTQNSAVLENLPDSFSREGTIGARRAVWASAWQGVQERPLLGWGPENFNVVFAKYFNPCMPLSECGKEIWFDRTHNIVLDNLINSGAIGLLAYLSIFASALFVVWRKFLRNDGDWLLPAVVTAALTSYFAQNLLVFDMMNTYLMFGLTLGLVAGISLHNKEDKNINLVSPKPFAIVVVGAVLIYYLFSFGVQSLQVSNWSIKIGRGLLNSQDTLELYKKSLTASPLGNRQLPEFFTNRLASDLASGTEIPEDFVAEAESLMVATVEKNSLTFRHRVILGDFYNSATRYNPEYIDRAKNILKEAIDLSPTNQQGYFLLGQTYIINNEYEKAVELFEKAVELEPDYATSHWLLSEAYRVIGDEKKSQESLNRALDLGYTLLK